LGAVYAHQIPNIGNATSPVPFDMYINCPAGHPAVRYRFQPVNGSSPGSGLLPLMPSSTGSGVAIQILNGSSGNTALIFGNNFSNNNFYWLPYNTSTGGNYTIPLRARLNRRAASVTIGSIEAQMKMFVQHN